MDIWPLPGSRVPFFIVTTLDGRRRSYDEIWQRSQVLLAVCPEEPDDVWRAFEARLDGARQRLAVLETELVITREPLVGAAHRPHRGGPCDPRDAGPTRAHSAEPGQAQPGDVPDPGPVGPMAVVADRWGEVTHSAPLERRDDRIEPDVDTLMLWVAATLHRCPECEGEAH
jgi:hypothetical protein